jgi:hypothetical protein
MVQSFITMNPKRSNFLRPLLLAACAAALIGTTGCVVVAAGAGAGAVAYVRGDLDTTLNADYEKVVAATREAIEQLEFAKMSDNKDALKAVLVSRTAQDKKVEITLQNTGKKITNVKIRVGVFGDEQLSLSILDKIKSNL